MSGPILFPPGLPKLTAAAAAIPGVKEAYQACYPLRRVGIVDDIAAAVSRVSSDECFMTEQDFQVNEPAYLAPLSDICRSGCCRL